MKKQIKLNEQQLKEFIAYSVKRLLKESYRSTATLELDPWENDYFMRAIKKTIVGRGIDVYDLVEKYEDLWPLEIDVEYVGEGPEAATGYEGYMEIIGWKIMNEIPQEISDIINRSVEEYMRDGDAYDKINDEESNFMPDMESDDDR